MNELNQNEKIKHIEIYVTEEEYKKLTNKKGEKSWKKFLLDLAMSDDTEVKQLTEEIKKICEKLQGEKNE